MAEKVWYCKIGEAPDVDVPDGADGPMREAVTRTYKRLTGREPDFIFSGFGAQLDEHERAVVEDRLPDPDVIRTELQQRIDVLPDGADADVVPVQARPVLEADESGIDG